MKTLILSFALAVLFAAMGYGCYEAGYQKGKSEKLETLETKEISARYFNVIGNPKTTEEQCKFDYIIYKDSTECN